MIDEKKLIERLLLKDALLFKDQDRGLVGVRVWRGKECKLFSKEPLANWDSMGHVALKTYGSDSQYISFFPKGCNKNLPDEKKHSESERDHLHSEEQDELYGLPDEEFLIKVNDIKAVNKKISQLTDAINKSKLNWFLWSMLLSSNSTHCSHLTHELLIRGGVKIYFLLKNKLMSRFFIYYFIKKFWLWIIALGILIKLTDNAHPLITWTFRYEDRLLAQGYSNFSNRLILSIFKYIIKYLDKIFNIAKEKGRSRGYIYGILSTAGWLTPIIAILIFIIKNYLILTPEDIYWIGKELEVQKNSNQIISSTRMSSWVYSDMLITDQVAWASVINTARSNDYSDLVNAVLGHATLVVEALREQIINLLQRKLEPINQKITELDKKYVPIQTKYKELDDLSKTKNPLIYWYRKIRMFGFGSSINEKELMQGYRNQLIELDRSKNKKKRKRNHIEVSLKKLTEFSPKARFIAICDIHAETQEKLLSLTKSEQNSLINSKGYIDKVQVQQYIFDQFQGVFLLDSRANFIKQNAVVWIDFLNKKILSSRKDERRIYPLAQGAFNQLIMNVESQSRKVNSLMEAKKYTELPKWQLAGKYHLLAFKNWDGLNCAEWCNDQLYQVGAISKGVATAKSKPPKGIKDLFSNSFSSVFGS